MYQQEVRDIDHWKQEEIQGFLKEKPNSLLYTSVPFLKLLRDFLGCEICAVLVRKNNKLVGYFPLAFKTHPVHGTICNSLPFYGSNGGMIIGNSNENEIRDLLLKTFNDLVQRRNCISTTIISNPLDQDGNVWMKENVKYNVVDERVGQITTELNSSPDDIEERLLKKFEDPRPRNIRKAQKSGIQISVQNTKDAIAFLYETHRENIMAINGIPKEEKFFTLLPEYFNDNEYKIYIAEHEGKKVAALLLFYFNKTVEYFTPAVVEYARNMQPTALIIYQAMIDAFKNGYYHWNWGGTWLSQGGVYDFKKKWGTEDRRYFYYIDIRDPKVYSFSKQELLSAYPNFFVIPFSELKK